MKKFGEILAESRGLATSLLDESAGGDHLANAKAAREKAAQHHSTSPEHHTAMGEHHTHMAKHHKAQAAEAKTRTKDNKTHDDLVHHLKTTHKMSLEGQHDTSDTRYHHSGYAGAEKVHAIKQHLAKHGFKVKREDAHHEIHHKGKTEVFIHKPKNPRLDDGHDVSVTTKH